MTANHAVCHASHSPSDPPRDAVGERAEKADAAVREILRLQYDGEPALLVPSPPGAGKTDLIEKLAAQAIAGLGERCLVVTQTNRQAIELVARLRIHFPRLPITFFCRANLALPDGLRNDRLVRLAHEAASLPTGPCVVVANAAKLATSSLAAPSFDLMTIDESWQLPNYQFLSIAGLASRVVLVGDPGQIAPVVRADITRWREDKAGPHVPAPNALLALHPDTRIVTLPVSRRLVDDSARIIQQAFYPNFRFEALESAFDRRIEFRRLTTATELDAPLAQIETGATISMLELPATTPMLADAGVASVIARTLARILARGAHLVTATGVRRLEADRLAVVCAHRAQVRAVRSRLGHGLANHVLVETANRFQGLERDVVIVWHPLSGRSSVHEFHLDAGRLCVMLSRHVAACLVVSRNGSEDMLDKYVPVEPPPLGGESDPEFDGCQAHRAVLGWLRQSDRLTQLRG